MKLESVQFDRYVGRDGERFFTERDYDIDFDGDHIVTITPLRPGLKLAKKVMVCAHNADMYPKEVAVAEPPADRPLPAKPRAKP